MPVTPTYPGVYVEEIPSGVRTIVGVATSITAFIGRAKRGPANKATTINSYGDFERLFGGLWEESSLGFAVRDFYLNGGSQAVVVRLFAPLFAGDTERQAALDAAKQKAQTAADAVAKAATDAAAIANPAPTAQSVAQAARGAVQAAGTTGLEAQAAAEAVAKAAEEAAAITAPQAATPASVANATTGAVAGAVTAAANAAAPITHAQLNANGLTLEAASPGAWGNFLRARVDHDVAESVATSMGLAKADLFNLTIRDTKTGITEQFRNLTINANKPRYVNKVLENESNLVRVKGNPAGVPTKHGEPSTGQDIFKEDTLSSKVTVPASDGNALTQANFTGSGLEGKKEGLYALEQLYASDGLFNILCLPPYTNTGDVDIDLVSKAAAYCETRRAMLLVDAPSGWKDKSTARQEFTGAIDKVGTKSKNAALFFPRLKQPNPLKINQLEEFVPSGAVAGLFARTDAQRGVWKAPAGIEATLVGVPQLSVLLTDEENGELNQLGINCLRAFPAAGRVIWGARTLRGADQLADEWKYIPVRRTALFIEETLYRALKWVVFEPNDEPLWAQIRLNVGSFMHNLFRQGAFQGSSPREAYFVKCDKETTIQYDIDRGIVNIHVGFAPLKPAEFVIIKLQQIAGQLEA